MATAATPTSTPPSEKHPTAEHAERIATHDRVPGHENYYEKDGLRTYGDGEDHDHEPPVRSENSRLLDRAYIVPDVLPPYHGLDSHGIYLDWIANSRLHIWFVLSPIFHVL
jgi:hypothetical protein